MKWLLSFPADEVPIPYYKEWVEHANIQTGMITSKDIFPADIESYDALLLTGGGDLDPSYYGVAKHPQTGSIDRARDEMELRLIENFLSKAKPVFGICRGAQTINVALGGTLIQHVPDIVGKNELHSKENGDDSFHPIRLCEGTRLADALKGAQETNSSHHQAIDPNHIGKGLSVAVVSGGGIIEAVECFEQNAPIVGVQWHPERMKKDHPASVRLINFWKELV